MRIDVVYPVQGARLVLRTELDWDRDIEPVSSTPSGARFEVECPCPTLALKPVLVRDGEPLWSQGADYVLTAEDPDPQIYPFFLAPARGRVSSLLHLQSAVGPHAVRIYHPPGYDENTLRRYPVVYMNDGQNLFFPEEAFGGHEWRVDETMDRLDHMNAIRKAVVVAISPADREREYTKPGYEEYARFLVEHLKPLVDQHLRTRRGPRDTVVMGSSLGGVASFHLAWQHPEVFGGAACLSSTFGYRDDLYERVGAEAKRPIRLYLDSGWPRDNYDMTNAMRDRLVSRGWRLGDDLLHFAFPDGGHDEDSWAMRAHVPFQFFLGRAWVASRR